MRKELILLPQLSSALTGPSGSTPSLSLTALLGSEWGPVSALPLGGRRGVHWGWQAYSGCQLREKKHERGLGWEFFLSVLLSVAGPRPGFSHDCRLIPRSKLRPPPMTRSSLLTPQPDL